MKYTVLVVVLALVTFATAQDGQITNGNLAAPGQFPYQVALHIDNRSFCGGSLISHQWIVTAAHCTITATSVRVNLGSNNNSGGTAYLVTRPNIRNHPGYVAETLLNDIALLRIPFTRYTRTIQRVSLPRIARSYPSFAGQTAFASGWGSIANTQGNVVNELRWARMPIISNQECSQTFGIIKDSNICVSTVGGISTCQGDSGGPLVLPGRNRLLVGITSFVAARGCAIGFPAGFTRVTSFLPWIKEVTRLNL